jgi:hypothetical protein
MSLLLVSLSSGAGLMEGLGGRNRKVAEAYVTQKKVRETTTFVTADLTL